MTFKINPIKPAMSHEEKVYEYARRISNYSLLASEERRLSKVFKCENILRNLDISGKSCGCFSNEIMFSEARGNADRHKEPCKPCKPCIKANVHYSRYRDAKSKQGAAMRQLNKEMSK